MKLLLKNGRIVDPVSGIDERLDILLEDGAIARIGKDLGSPPLETLDVRGLVVVPGLIDMHVHLREPGYEEKETIASGGRAAARGGFTTVCCMPNTNPVNDRRGVTESILAEARRSSPVNVLPVASVTMGQNGAELTDMAELAAAGAVAFSDDGRPVMDGRVMNKALETARALNTLIIDHCEDVGLSGGGVMHEGDVSSRLDLKGIPSDSESSMALRDIRLAEEAGARIHIAHASAAGTVEAVRAAKSRGVGVTAEVTPHHLLLTESALEGGGADFKMNPPLRSRADVSALIEAVRSGVVDVIATDHAPHTPEEKALGLEKAPFGVIGLETAVALILDRMVRAEIISLGRFAELLSVNPARILGLANKGRIAERADADLTLLDLSRETVVDRTRFVSKARNTPFHGWTLKGAAVMTIVGGRVVYPFRADSPSSSRAYS